MATKAAEVVGVSILLDGPLPINFMGHLLHKNYIDTNELICKLDFCKSEN